MTTQRDGSHVGRRLFPARQRAGIRRASRSEFVGVNSQIRKIQHRVLSEQAGVNGERAADVEDIAGFLDQCELTSRRPFAKSCCVRASSTTRPAWAPERLRRPCAALRRGGLARPSGSGAWTPAETPRTNHATSSAGGRRYNRVRGFPSRIEVAC